MARTKDITDKLSFDGNPSLMIKGKKLEVNSDAPTMLKILGIMSSDEKEMKQLNESYQLIFPEKSRKEIEKMRLSVTDWITVVEEALNLIMDDGSGDEPGEQ